MMYKQLRINYYYYQFTDCQESSCKESQSVYNLTPQASNLFASQISCNIADASLNTPKSRPICKKKKDATKASLYEQIQSTPLLCNKENVKSTTPGPNMVVPDSLEPNYRWTWKSLDNLTGNGKIDSNPRIYATRVDRSYTLYRKDIFYSGSIYNLRGTTEDTQVKETNIVNGDIPCICNRKCTGFQCTTSLENQMSDAVNKNKSSKVFRKIFDILSEMTNFTLFTDPLFLMYAISCTLTMFGEFFASYYPTITNGPLWSFVIENALTCLFTKDAIKKSYP